MDIRDFSMKNITDMVTEEKNNLELNLTKIDNVINKWTKDINGNKDEVESIVSIDYENASYKRDLISNNYETGNKISNYKTIKKNPYFGRMLLNSNNETIDMYVGEQSIVGLDHKNIVYDWRFKIANLFYQNQTNYSYNNYNYVLELKRKILIENSQIIKCVETYSKNIKQQKIVDEFLQRVLANKKNTNEFVDIIKTIQSKQNDIIRDDINKNVIVQGIAGSGKTVIILHRLSYLLFNNPDINPNSFMFITPTDIFKDKLNALNKKLQIDKISMFTLLNYYNGKLRLLFYDKVIQKDNVKIIPWVEQVINDDYESNQYLLNKYSNSYYLKVKKYIEDIISEKIKAFYSITNIENVDINNNTCIALKNIKEYLESYILELLKDKQLYEQKIDIIFNDYYSYLNKVLNYKENDNMRYIDHDLTYQKMTDLIIKEISEIRDKTLDKYSYLDQYERELKEIENKLYEIKTNINKKLSLMGIESTDNINDIEYNLDYYFKDIIESKIQLKIELNKLSLKLDNNNRKITNRSKSVFRFLYTKSREKLLRENVEIESKMLEKSTYIKDLNDIVNNSKNEIEQLLIKYEQNYSITSEKRNKINNLNQFEKKFEEFNILLAKIYQYRGILSLSKETQNVIYKCYNLFYNSYYNEIESTEFDYIAFIKDLNDSINLPLILSIKNDIIGEIDKILTPKYLWDKYKEYLLNNDQIAHDNYYSSKGKKISRVDAYLLLRLAQDLGYINRHNYSYIYIDEAQDYNGNEIMTIYLLEGKPVLNIYGDVKQKIFDNVQERKDWSSLKSIIDYKFHCYELNENYRNTVELVEYCNKKLLLKMLPIGNNGENVKELTFESIDDVVKKAKETNAVVISNNSNYLNSLKKKDVSCYNVFQVKGLEFTNVIVIDEDLSDNQKYVAYTRSLNDLIIYK